MSVLDRATRILELVIGQAGRGRDLDVGTFPSRGAADAIVRVITPGSTVVSSYRYTTRGLASDFAADRSSSLARRHRLGGPFIFHIDGIFPLDDDGEGGIVGRLVMMSSMGGQAGAADEAWLLALRLAGVAFSPAHSRKRHRGTSRCDGRPVQRGWSSRRTATMFFYLQHGMRYAGVDPRNSSDGRAVRLDFTGIARVGLCDGFSRHFNARSSDRRRL